VRQMSSFPHKIPLDFSIFLLTPLRPRFIVVVRQCHTLAFSEGLGGTEGFDMK
jgi:hypothetical protein